MNQELEDRRRSFANGTSYATAKPIEIDGEWFIPFSIAAKRACVWQTTLVRWVSRGPTPNGWLLQAFQDLERRYFISEKSLRLLENRFVDVHTDKPVENVFIRRTQTTNRPIPDGKELYCSTNLAAQMIGVHQATVIKWFKTGRNPLGEPLRAVRDLISADRFIAQATVESLRVKRTVK